MDVYYNLDSLRKISNPVVTIGSYDGVHAGHKEIIRQLNRIATEIDGESVIITFSPHPREILFDSPQKLINTLDEKITLLDQEGVNVLIVIPFTLEFGTIEPHDFVADILVNAIGVSKLIIGYDHKFGRGNRGDIELLKSLQSVFNFEVIQIPQYDVDSNRVSSTIVREALTLGHISDVNKFIGSQYFISGTISSRGDVNISNKNKLLPPSGEYPVIVCYKPKPIETTLTISEKGAIKLSNICCKSAKSNIIIKFI